MNRFVDFYELMNGREKLSFFGVVLITLFIGVLDVLGISVLLPVFQLLTGDEINNPMALWVLSTLNFKGIDNLYFFICLFFLSKFFVFLLAIWVQARFIFGFKVKYSQLMVNKMLGENLGATKANTDSQRLRMLTVDLIELTNRFVAPLISALSEIIALLLMAGLALILISPNFYQFLASLALFIVAFFLVFSRFSAALGLQRNGLESKRISLIEFLFVGQIEIRTYAKQQAFVKKTLKILEDLKRVESLQEVFQQMPRMFIETTFIIFFLWFFIIQPENQQLVRDSLSEIMLLGVLIVRSLPSINRLLRSSQTLAYSKHILADIIRQITSADSARKSELSAIHETIDSSDIDYIRLVNLRVRYDHDTSEALHIANLELSRGRWYGLVGESGTGKSTLLKVLLGQMQPVSGKISTFKGASERVLPGLFNWANAAIVSQNYPIFEDTVLENIRFDFSQTIALDDQETVKSVLSNAGLGFADKDGVSWDAKSLEQGGRNISGGQRQRIGLARALYADADLLVLDEATSALDEGLEDQILDNLKGLTKDKIVIFVTHRKKNYRHFDKIIDMNQGGILRDPDDA